MEQRTCSSCLAGKQRVTTPVNLLSLAFLSLFLFVTASETQAQQARRILVLNSYHKEFQWTDDQTSAIKEVLTEAIEDLEFYVEYMDTKRIYTPEYLDHFHRVLQLKYANIKLDGIVATDDNALRFVMEHHKDVFGGAPVSFCGINDYPPSLLAGKDAFTGLIEVLDIKPTIDLALKLHPNTQTVYIIVDNTPTGTGQRRAVEQISQQYKFLTFEYLSGDHYSHSELLEKLRTLPENGVVLLTVWLRDRTNTYIPVGQGGPAISSASTVPVYGIITMFLKQGIVGGKLLSSHAQGRTAAELMLRVLDGEKPSDIGVITESVNPYMFDFTQLQRWHIDMTDLPKESLMVNEPQSFYYKYSKLIWIVITIVVLESALITALIMTIVLRKRIEKALGEEKYRLAKAQEIGSIGTWEMDLVENILTWTKENHNIFGIPDGTDLTYETFLECVHPDDREYVNTEWVAGVNGKPYDIEHRIIANGKVKWVREKAELLYDKNGKAIRAVGVTQDITERKQAEKELRKKEETIRALVESSQDWIWEINLEGVHTFCSPAIERILGYKQEDLIGHSSLDFVVEEDRKIVEEKLPDWIARKEGWRNLVIRWRHKDGGYRYLESNAVPILDSQDNLAGFRGVDRDITERKQAEEALCEMQEYLMAALGQSPSGILIADAPNVSIRLANQAALGIRGGDSSILTGIDVERHGINWQTYYPDGSPYPSEQLPLSRAVLQGQVTQNEELIIRDENGNEHWVSTNAAPIRDSEGKVIAGIVIFHDITERRRIEAERERLFKTIQAKNEELQSVVYVASHDLRSPLVNISGFGGELSETCLELRRLLNDNAIDDDLKQKLRPLLDENIPESLKYMKAGAAKMESLLNGLLQVSRIGTAKVEVKPLDVNEMMSDIRQTMEFQISKTGAEIIIDDLPDCRGDEVMVNQIFSNIMVNALKYLDPTRQGKVHISGRTENGMSIYCVEDNGIGIAPAHQPKIFEVFHRLDPDDDAGGEGLGLSIVMRILDRLDGQIRVESEPGKGSRFFVSLPAVMA